MNLLITVRLHDGRYHGEGDWPPAPARLFQALVAGAGLSGPLGQQDSEALRWLEQREAPLIGAPVAWVGQRVMFYMPNNDLDTVQGDPRRIAEIRSAIKVFRPRLFDPMIPFLYAWALHAAEDSERHSQQICALAEHLYQLGRGLDMAWANGEVLEDEKIDARLSSYSGRIYRPSRGGKGDTLACPQARSLESLTTRYAANTRRFKTEGHGKSARQLFSQPPKPQFVQVAYESPPARRIYELRDGTSEASFGVWPLARVSKLVEWLREGAVRKLHKALPNLSSEIERVMVGRKADGSDDGPTAARVRVVPLPSIGHPHADRGIRRVLVEVPAGCPLRADDVHWAFSGLDFDPEAGEVLDLVLTPSVDTSMLAHYGVADRTSFRAWRTVTPAALPESARRRRIEPTRAVADAKDGAESAAEQARAAAAVTQALRHADVRAHVEAIRVQREPFEARGERVEAFAPGTRFPKERLWHVEITFNMPIAGPLVIGDGRFLGLGVMCPVSRDRAIYAFVVDGGLTSAPQPSEVARALRRAVMARVQEVLGTRANLPAFFSGHERDGSPAQTESRPHLTFLFDPGSARLLIVAPHVVDRRDPTREERSHMETLDTAMTDFRELRAGSAGCLMVRASAIDPEADPLFAPSRVWRSVTPYQVTRHMKHVGAAEALSTDVRAECRRCGLPEPHVTPLEPRGVPGVGLVGHARFTFEVAVEGPVILGRSRHLGGGLFAGDAD